MSSVSGQIRRVISMMLRDLIAEHRKRTGESYADIAARGGVSRQFVHRLASGGLRQMPRPLTMTNLAIGLGVSEQTVRDAALAELGMVYRADELADARTERIIVSMGALSDDDLDVVEEMVAAMRRRRRGK